MPSDQEGEVVRVAEMFGDVARLLAGHHSLQVTLDKMVNLAVENLHSCEFAGISQVKGRELASPASSNEVPRIVDAIQAEVDEGPCLDAIKEHEVVQTGDLAAEERWPHFAKRANDETGICSILSIRLFIEEDTMGALNLYSRQRDAFDDNDVAFGTVFAVHAAVAMDATRREDNLERKADSRDLIGRAKGMLMARSGLSDEEAFDLLRRASQRQNIKVVAVAKQIVHPVAGEPPVATLSDKPDDPG
ncbi:MAG: GAF and ANTAR domain-containing protein [Acidimicrobiales bacterium]